MFRYGNKVRSEAKRRRVQQGSRGPQVLRRGSADQGVDGLRSPDRVDHLHWRTTRFQSKYLPGRVADGDADRSVLRWTGLRLAWRWCRST